ncbi:MAG: hypothetical protein IJW70_07410 [Clostridia bacterium]|nr:hypothetical protein [Clostridia bacterium]
MNIVKFETAKAVFYPYTPEEYARVMREDAVGQYGFYYALDLSEYCSEDGELMLSGITARLTARNFYRLYINGEMIMHGPARTAHGYARVDEVDVTWYLEPGMNHIAIEVVAYGHQHPIYNRYSNDCTMEDGMVIAELCCDGRVLCATGREDWQVCHVNARVPVSERISHSRECTEIYCMDDQYYLWKVGKSAFVPAALVGNEPVYLLHEALQPTLEESFFDDLVGFGSCHIDANKKIEPLFYEQHSPAYEALSEHPTADCRRTVDTAFGGVCAEYGDEGLMLWGDEGMYATFDGGESRVGFVRLVVSCEKAGVIDVVHSELLDTDGSIPYYHNVVARLHLPAGLTEFIAFEPCLVRYVKLYFRGTGAVSVHSLSVLDYAYPDEHRTSFSCSDENINRLYAAAKKTLLLNTLDIFMDCPERERGGWLCDSLWTARAAALMLSDPRVEREFIETFLLTPAEGMFHGFFPEVYPGLKSDYRSMTGITTWSFWLGCEIAEYISRTGDIAFRDEYAPRVEAFVSGTRDFVGKSGLLENLPWLFIDWSQSNWGENNQPVSTAANALYAYMLCQLGKTFARDDWTAEGENVRKILRDAVMDGREACDVGYIPDSFAVDENGGLHSRGKYSEAAMYTALWSGLFAKGEAPMLERAVKQKMGPAPVYAKDPMVGTSNLFIGLCIRLDMLTRFGAYDKMYEDMLAIYMPQLKEGPGTLWENEMIDTSSRCHGFAAHVGVHLLRDVLGLGIPCFDARGEGEKHIEITPHICGLRWARGTHETPDGLIALEWRYDGEHFALSGSLPAGYTYTLSLPSEIRALEAECVKVNIITRG